MSLSCNGFVGMHRNSIVICHAKQHCYLTGEKGIAICHGKRALLSIMVKRHFYLPCQKGIVICLGKRAFLSAMVKGHCYLSGQKGVLSAMVKEHYYLSGQTCHGTISLLSARANCVICYDNLECQCNF